MPRSKPAREARLLRDELFPEFIWGTMMVETVYVRFIVSAATKPSAMKMTVQMIIVLRPAQSCLTKARISMPSSW